MEMKIHFKTLPTDMTLEQVRQGLDMVLEDDGWLLGSGQVQDGAYVELQLEDEKLNPKYGILAVKNYLQQIKSAPDTTMELAGLQVGVYE